MGDPTVSRQGSGAYQYLPLNEEAGEIRLLYLLPSPFSSPIQVVLESTPFSPEAPPQFEALSYTWGSAENLVDIFVGSSGYHTLAVTQNLAEALPYLRLEDRSWTLWIDAICVNQSERARSNEWQTFTRRRLRLLFGLAQHRKIARWPSIPST
jgi:hypothetical protein